MHRDDDDVFVPPSAVLSIDSKDQTLWPPPGPSAAWTAEGVISALEPLVLEERRRRLMATLEGRTKSLTVVLDHPHDPHNGSAVMRSCDAFGVQRIHVVTSHEAFAASKMVAKGSQRWVDIIEHQSPHTAVSALRAEGFQILVTHPEGRLVPRDLKSLPRVALVLGNERDGVGAELTAAADDTVRIPMRGFVESLNMSVTAAILIQGASEGRDGDLSEHERLNVYARWLRNTVPRSLEVLRALAPC